MPPSFTTRPHLAISFVDEFAELGGAHAHDLRAFVRELLLHLRRSCTAAISLCSLATMAAGVPAGATMPNQLVTS